MNTKALKQAAEELLDQSSPAYGLAKLLAGELVDIQAGMPGRLSEEERVYIAEAIKLQLFRIERLSCRLLDNAGDEELSV